MKRPKIHTIEGACVVCALHYAVGIDEFAVLRACKSYGFTEKRGMEDTEWRNAAGLLGLRLRLEPTEPIELRKVIKKYPKGLFLLGTFDHLFVLDHGILYDPRGPKTGGLRRTIKQIWRVVGGSDKI
jgi:hypothetical protein